MEWTCTECGSSAVAAAARLLVTMGWRVTGDETCVCAPCTKKDLDLEPLLRAAAPTFEPGNRVVSPEILTRGVVGAKTRAL